MTTSLLIALTIDPQVSQQIVKTKMISHPHNIAAREVATLEWCTNPSTYEILSIMPTVLAID